MFYKVKIKKIPTARVGMQVQGALSNDTMPFNGKGTTQMNSVPAPSVKKTLQPVARKDANLEAEKGETVIGNIDGSNMPSLFNIGGKRHVNGGTPLNLPDDSFIFSDTKSMMIKDPKILKMFGKSPRKGGYTPADLSKSYDMNKYRKILQDKNSDAIDKRTAEMMIKNYVIKLGALALAQESQKGFPQGIPALAQPYMETNGISEEDLIPPAPEPAQAPAPQQQMGQQQMPAPQTMPDGSPIAQPQTMEQDMAQMQQPTPNQMMQWGGVRMLKRAQEGMQQPSEQEMAMMQQQQAQQQQQPQAQPQQAEQGQEDPMQQMMQQVEQALQQGSKPEEVVAQLMQNQVPPDQIAQIFVQLGMPEEQVQELVTGVMQEMQGGQKQQMDPRQQQQQQAISEEEMMAMQQEDPQQMQQASMAPYGMQMGGYTMPDYMQYGGYFQDGGRPLTTAELEARRKTATNIRKEKAAPTTGYTKLSDGTYAKGTIREGQIVSSSLGTAKPGKSKSTTPSPAWKKTICDELSKGVSVEELAKPDKNGNSHGTVAGLTAMFADCIKKGEAVIKTGTEDFDILQVEEDCPCVDEKGVPMKNADGTPMFAKKDANGKCLPCTEAITTCECKDPKTGKTYDPGKDIKGICNDCTKVIPPKVPPPPAKWWLQDTVNTMGAFGDLARVKKEMPWEARVDLEEPRPVFLDPTRELAAQSEQANIASQATGQFAGAQGQGARLSAIQGQGAEAAANTLSRINNANVGIANQFEGQQVGIRNQENMLNQQMANRVYDKNVIANQQFANAKTAGRSNLRQSYNTGVTNKWKTDALNQMYPNYQTDTGSGGRITYTPTDKTLDKGAEEQTPQQFADSISGYTPKMQELLFQQKYGKQFGGQQFEHGGYVYSVFPSITL